MSNPYAPPVAESAATEHSLDTPVKQLFRARKWALLSSIPLILFVGLAGEQNVGSFAFAISALVFCFATTSCWFFIFRVVRPMHGTLYAIGHVAASMILTPAFLIGLILIPLLVRGDVERLAGIPESN